MSHVALLNPFAEALPSTVETTVDASAICARFNPTGIYAGHHLAVGRSDGIVSIIDFESKNVVRFLEGHVRAITSICWSRKCRYLMSASRDWNIIIWDLSTGDRRHTIRFDAPVTSASLHPKNSNILVATLQNQAETIFVDLRPNGGRWELNMEVDLDGPEPSKGGRKRETATTCRFSPKGDLIFVGSSLGSLYIFETASKSQVHHERVSANSSIKNMEFDRSGSAIVVNSSDRNIRVLSLDISTGTLNLEHKFQDLINRTPWNRCNFSADGEYVLACGGTAHNTSNNVYIWDRATGALSRILEGAKDPMEDCDWHPTRPVVVTVSDQGYIHVWVTPSTEHWAAYAPGFEELEENLEYQEREDEFDIIPESELDRRRMDEQQEVVVDVFDTPEEEEEDVEVDPTDDNDAFLPAHESDLHFDGNEAVDFGPVKEEKPVVMARSASASSMGMTNGRAKAMPSDEQMARDLQASMNGRSSRTRRR